MMAHLLMLPYGLAYLVGASLRLGVWLVAAVVAGYKAGRGDNPMQ